MSVVRLNENAHLIDCELFGIREAGAVYLVRANKSCLIDAGTRAEAGVIVRELDALGAFPPDILILTHCHFDHAQGTPALCQEAEKRGKAITVMASVKGVSSLHDQSWNSVFDDKHQYENITDVTPLEDGQTVDLDGLCLKVLNFSGHCIDDIALYDESHKTVFVGDSLGNRVKHTTSFPGFMPPFWDPDGFRAAVDRLKHMDYERICLAHFGCLEGDEAQRFPDEAVETYETWWDIFHTADQEGKLDDKGYLNERLFREAGLVLPELQVSKPTTRIMMNLVNLIKRVLGQKPIDPAEIQLEIIVGWLAKGYRTYMART